MRKRLFPLIALFCTVLSLTGPAVAAEPAAREIGWARYIEFDVAEKIERFSFDEAPVLDNGFPAYGNAFITQGFIYPAGVLQNGNGIDPETGGPEFPNLVIGEWTCRGYFVGEGMATTTGPIVITTQVYDLGDEPGDRMFVSEGYELADIDKEVKRAITGGTGMYRNIRGDVVQTLLGLNQKEGVNLRIRVQMRRR